MTEPIGQDDLGRDADVRTLSVRTLRWSRSAGSAEPHGVRGDVFVEPWTDAPEERFADGAVVYAGEADRRPLTVAASRSHSGKLVVHFAGLEDRNAVESIRGLVLVVPITDRPPLSDPDEFYDSDLLGLSVSHGGRHATRPGH